MEATAEGQPTTTERSDPNSKALVGPLVSTPRPIIVGLPFMLPPQSPRPELATSRAKATFTFEECFADAKKYPSRTHWQFRSGKIYDHARLMRWTDACCEHMSKKRVVHPLGYWTKERISVFAKQFTSRTEWSGLHNQSYNYARSKGWLDELTQHMPFPKSAAKKPKPLAPVRASVKPSGYWTKERVLKCARQYSSRTQFTLMDHAAYNKAMANGWIVEATAHMPGKKPASPKGYWTEQRCADIAKGYNRRVDWAAYHSQSYNIARKKGWLDKLTKHMAPPATKGSPKKVVAPIEKVKRPIVASKKVKRPIPTPKNKVPTNTVSKEFQFAIKNAGMMPRGYWTKARVIAVARMYPSRSQWRNATPGIYNYATKKGLLTSATRHMVDPNYMKYTRPSRGGSIKSVSKPIATARPKAVPPVPVLEKPVVMKPKAAITTPMVERPTQPAAEPQVQTTTSTLVDASTPTLNWRQRIWRFFGE